MSPDIIAKVATLRQAEAWVGMLKAMWPEPSSSTSVAVVVSEET